ncbi:MRC [Mytilus coruscus]|uniref:MRC n=1 Tax=Mytilus coruscus TaxID=42192 RepID=A0A6J7ZSR6_MYTCO|nr:MRC [Mytilus coruscus]
MWIGLNDRQTDGHWVWDSDNSTLTYNDWDPNEPNGGERENCCMFCKTRCRLSSFRWNDFPYNLELGYQCTVRTLRVDADKTGARLNGYTYITFSNIGPNACFNECIRRTRCRSFNYNSITRRCDINKMSSNSETDFVDETNCVYVNMTQYRGDSFYDPCPGSDSCVEGEFCQTLKDNIKICLKDVKDEMWIGLNDRQTEGHWVWDSDNSTLTYNDWDPVEPNGGETANCCMFCKTRCGISSFRWNDDRCYVKLGYVCEKLL